MKFNPYFYSVWCVYRGWMRPSGMQDGLREDPKSWQIIAPKFVNAGRLSDIRSRK